MRRDATAQGQTVVHTTANVETEINIAQSNANAHLVTTQ